MNSLNTIKNAIKEILHLEKHIFFFSIFVAIIDSIIPFLNIYILSDLVLQISNNNRFFVICIRTVLFLLIFSVLIFFSHYFNDMYYMYRNLMFIKEKEKISKKLFKLNYNILNNPTFQELIYNQANINNGNDSAFTELTWMIKDFTYGLITIIISLIIFLPMLKIGLRTYSDIFFDTPFFLLSILLSIIIFFCIITIITFKLNKKTFNANKEYTKLNRLYDYFFNLFNDYKTGKEIRIYNEKNIINNLSIDILLNKGKNILKKSAKYTAKISALIAILGSIISYGVYVFIGIKTSRGLYNINSIILYCGSFIQIIRGTMRIANTFGKTSEITPLFNYYFEIINAKDNQENENKSDINLTDSIKEIEFRNVYFKYPNSENFVLKNVSFVIKNKENIAIVGRNGSGKTTLVNLICGLYKVTSGEILINSININDYSKENLFKTINAMFQDYNLFSLPLYQNVSCKKIYNKNKIIDCLTKTNIYNHILKFPYAEKTYLFKDIENNGVDLSGGEMQKIAFARSLYKNSTIVILDEPTAALDPISEKELYTKYYKYFREQITIFISHRLSSCSFCDKIIVMDNGEIIQEGSHKELLKQSNNLYYSMWYSQAKYYE